MSDCCLIIIRVRIFLLVVISLAAPPPPCDDFTLTPVGERRAALFGGDIGPELAVSDDLLIVELTQYKTVVSV